MRIGPSYIIKIILNILFGITHLMQFFFQYQRDKTF